MKNNEEHILFLRKSAEGKLVMNGGPHGKFELEEGLFKSLPVYKSLSGKTIDEDLNEIE